MRSEASGDARATATPKLGFALALGFALVGLSLATLRQRFADTGPRGAAISQVPPSHTAVFSVAASQDLAGYTEGDATIQALADRFFGDTDTTGKGERDAVLCELRALLTPRTAAQFARGLSAEQLGTPCGLMALEVWLAAEPLVASEWIAAHASDDESLAWLVAHTLTRQPELLASFCDRLADGPWSESFFDHASRAVLRENPAAAVSLAQSLPPGDRQVGLFETIACDWMERDPAAAEAWIRTVPELALRERLVAVGAQSYASTSPLGAMEWLLREAPADAFPAEAVRVIFGIWREIAPHEAAAWFNFLPRSELTVELAGEK